MDEKKKKKKFFRFLRDKWFYISLIIMASLTVGAFELTFVFLEKYTRHNDEIEVPDFTDQNYDELIVKYRDKFTFILTDSTYKQGKPKGVVYEQNPLPGSKAKPGRNIYVKRTLVAQELVKMPNLHNLSLRQAMVTLKDFGLKVEKLEYINYFARNAVIEQKFNDTVIAPNDEVVKGSAITLVVGLGNGDKTTNIPDLVGLNKSEVKNHINGASLNMGSEFSIDYDDDENLYVSRMEPEYSTDRKVPLGSFVNVWYRSSKNFDVDWYNYEKFRRDSIADSWRLKKYSADTIKYVVDSFNYVLKHRTFSFDPKQRELDKKMIFRSYEKNDVEIDFDFSDFEDDDFEIDTSFFYYE